MNLPPISDATAEDIQLGPMEVTTAELAEILGVTVPTVTRWVNQEQVLPEREWNWTGGRPTYVFDLQKVREDFESMDHWRVPGYIAALDAGIDRRWRDAHGSQPSDEGWASQDEVDAALNTEDRSVLDDFINRLDQIAGMDGALREANDQAKRLAATQMALAKIVAHQGHVEMPTFTYDEAICIHNALAVYDAEYPT